MNFNYQARYKKFRNDERRFAMEAFRGGMKREDVLEIIKLDWEEFKGERNYCRHNQRFEAFSEGGNHEDENPLQQRFLEMVSTTDEYLAEGMGNILQDLDNKELFDAICGLSDKQKELLYQLIFMDKRECDLAEEQKVTQSSIGHRYQRIRKKIRKNY